MCGTVAHDKGSGAPAIRSGILLPKMQNRREAVVKASIFHSYEPFFFPYLTEVLPGGIEAVISALLQHEDKDGPVASFSAIGSTIGNTSSTPSKLEKV
jgi:hypothetical protein